MVSVRDGLKHPDLSAEDIALFEEGVINLTRLERDLALLMDEHDRWQMVDTEFPGSRMTGKGTEELDWSWGSLKPMLAALCGDPTQPKVYYVKEDFDRLQVALDRGADLKAKKRAFRSLRRSAGIRFHSIDTKLLETCEDLGKIGEPLAVVLRFLAGGPTHGSLEEG